MHPIAALRQRAAVSQGELAAAAGTSQPTIAAYEAGRKSPTLRTVARLAASVGFEAAVVFVPPMTREDRRSLELHRSIAAALVDDPEAVRRTARRNVARMAAANPGARRLLAEWRRVLDGPLEELLELLVDPSQRARDLRQVTPFAGVLSAHARWRAQRRMRSVGAR